MQRNGLNPFLFHLVCYDWMLMGEEKDLCGVFDLSVASY